MGSLPWGTPNFKLTQSSTSNKVHTVDQNMNSIEKNNVINGEHNHYKKKDNKMCNSKSYEKGFIEQRGKNLNEQNKDPWCDKEEYWWHRAGINSYKKESHGNTGYEICNSSNKALSKWDM